MGERQKLLISWSGQAGQTVGQALHKWLKQVLQGIEPFMSKHSLPSGAEWARELRNALQTTHMGIVLMTPAATRSHWVSFEAGAISKNPDSDACVVPLYLGVTGSDLSGPFTIWQGVEADKEGIRKMLGDLNKRLVAPLDASDLDGLFEAMWPSLKPVLDAGIEEAKQEGSVEHIRQRAPADKVSEILDLVRSLDRNVVELKAQSERWGAASLAGGFQIYPANGNVTWSPTLVTSASNLRELLLKQRQLEGAPEGSTVTRSAGGTLSKLE